MKNKLHQNAKAKPKKDSLVDFIRRFSDEDRQVKFFISIKFPEGFVCDRCKCHEYYLIKRSGVKNGYILQCKECSKQQHTLLGGTILDNSNFTLLQILIALYLFFTSNRGLSAPDLDNNIDVSVITFKISWGHKNLIFVNIIFSLIVLEKISMYSLSILLK